MSAPLANDSFLGVLTPEYQLKLLAVVCRDPTFLPAYADVAEPRWFEDATHADFARLALEYFQRYRKGPTLPAIKQAVRSMLDADPRRADRSAEYEEVLRQIASATLEEREDVVSRAARFAQESAVAQALLASAEDIETGKIAEIVPRLQEAMMVGANRADLGLDYFADFARLAKRRQDDAVATGFAKLDNYLDGGLCPGELGVIVGPPGGFKSGMLVNMGAGALREGCDVVHLSCEIKEENIGKRYDGCLFGMTRQRGDLPADLEREIAAFREKTTARLYVKRWPQNTATVEMMRGYLHSLAIQQRILHGRRLVLVVDYGQIMAPSRRHNDKRHEQRENYQGLIALGTEFACPVWSAAQANRGSIGKDKMGLEAIAECLAIAADADVVLTLPQSESERDTSILRISLQKVREAQSKRDVAFNVDYSLSRLSAFHGALPERQAEAKHRLRERAAASKKRLDDDRQKREAAEVAELPATRRPAPSRRRRPAPAEEED